MLAKKYVENRLKKTCKTNNLNIKIKGTAT